MTKNRDIRAYRGLIFKLQHPPLVVSTSNERNLSVVIHNTSTVAIVEDVSKRFCEIIRYVFYSTQMSHDYNFIGVRPVLQHPISNIHVTATVGRSGILIYHLKSGHVVDVD